MSSDLSRERIATALFPRISRRALLLCGGTAPPMETLAWWLDGADLFVCTDAAGSPYENLPRRPDLVIGDFDTLRNRPNEEEDGGTRYLLRGDQIRTDSEKALIEIAKLGFGEVVLLGARGGRIDHSLHNLSLIESYAGMLRICLADEWNLTVRLAPGASSHFDLPAGTLFSLLTLAGPARGVGLKGAEYPLSGAALRFGGDNSVSNRVAEPPLRVDLEEGSLLLSAALSEQPPGAEG